MIGHAYDRPERDTDTRIDGVLSECKENLNKYDNKCLLNKCL